MYSDVVRLVDGFYDALVVFPVGHKINVVGVEYENAHIVLLLDEVKITLLQMLKIRIVDFLLVVAAAFVYIMLQMLDVEIKVHHQLGFGDV